jgi:hypothetical protein
MIIIPWAIYMCMISKAEGKYIDETASKTILKILNVCSSIAPTNRPAAFLFHVPGKARIPAARIMMASSPLQPKLMARLLLGRCRIIPSVWQGILNQLKILEQQTAIVIPNFSSRLNQLETDLVKNNIIAAM